MIDTHNWINSQRRHQRSSAKAMFRVYSSVVAGSQLITATDVSLGGAFLSTRLVPHLGETVTCKVIDQNGAELWTVNARVAWVNDKDYAGKVGFGVEFHKLLTVEQELQIQALQNGQEVGDIKLMGRPTRHRYR